MSVSSHILLFSVSAFSSLLCFFSLYPVYSDIFGSALSPGFIASDRAVRASEFRTVQVLC